MGAEADFFGRKFQLAIGIRSPLLSQRCGVLSDFSKGTFCDESVAALQLPIFSRKENLMKQTIFSGAATALVTPLTDKGIDFEALGRLIEFQIEGGISALVITGTTGESSTLSDEEHKAAIEFAVKQSAGRVPVIAGTGSNDTDYAIALSRHACEVGVDGLLLVTPYYNKATQNGLIAHFTAIADAVTKPIILYNVPSRTGCNLKPETVGCRWRHCHGTCG